MMYRNHIAKSLPLQSLKKFGAAFLVAATAFAGLPFAPVASAARYPSLLTV